MPIASCHKGSTNGMASSIPKLASFPDNFHLQSLIDCHMQTWRGEGLGDLVTCSASGSRCSQTKCIGTCYISSLIPRPAHPSVCYLQYTNISTASNKRWGEKSCMGTRLLHIYDHVRLVCVYWPHTPASVEVTLITMSLSTSLSKLCIHFECRGYRI